MSITICMTGIISCKIISEPHGKTVKRIDLPRSIFKNILWEKVYIGELINDLKKFVYKT